MDEEDFKRWLDSLSADQPVRVAPPEEDEDAESEEVEDQEAIP